MRRGLALSPADRQAISEAAGELITALRAPGCRPNVFEQLLAHFSLSTEEGLALMGLAETLLRVPDDATALELVKERLAQGDWARSQAAATAFWPRLAARGVGLGSRVVNVSHGRSKALRRLSAPLVLALARRAMAALGDEFIMGPTLETALDRGHEMGALCSFDLLGEGARTDGDAIRYRDALLAVIGTLGTHAKMSAAADAPVEMPVSLRRACLSVKLSALEPRYEEAQRVRVLARLVPTLCTIFEAAAGAGIGVTIDAEEQDRLELSLDVLAAALKSPRLARWDGAGLAVQAYGTRALRVIDWAAACARSRGAPLHVRLVKGAYWDTEVKRAQERGLAAYPVFTRKAATDVAYLAGAQRLFAYPGILWPQFATHNPHTLCAVRELAGPRPYELQRLHGMGVRLYRAAAERFADFPSVRVYAPVGDHRALLPYLVRRLLENGANTSFLSAQDDAKIAPAVLAADPLSSLEESAAPGSQSELPPPTTLFQPERPTARTWDLGCPQVWRELRAWHTLACLAPSQETGPCVSGHWQVGCTATVRSPAAVTEFIGEYRASSSAVAREALAAAYDGQRAWARESAETRARCLERAAQGLERAAPKLLPLLVREAGKCWPEAIAELREAVDFCRYYAARGREMGEGRRLRGPTGESNTLTWHGRGVFYCISPWNFPLAIFIGQIAAALVAGNSVLAKPAPQTTLIGAVAFQILLDAGVPAAVLHFLPGDGIAVSEVVLEDSRLAGVAFTGSTATAKRLHRALAERSGAIIPLIAETGGINAMIVDSTALLEQVVDDVVNSAFRAAGQRCSALRLLCIQSDIAKPLLEMLIGAMDTLIVGDPADPGTDVGPLIDHVAVDRINGYLKALPAGAKLRHRAAVNGQIALGHFCTPALVEIEAVGDLIEEIFGPVLHVVRFAREELDSLVAAIEDSGYGLTLGVHSRSSRRAQEVFAASRIGNTYVNRNMVGAVVGVQPFGGEGLSGTGPKAGGPNYLQRFAVERVFTVNETAWGGNVSLLRGANL
jgi:RHH-type proline utilization regulon transcriptional repressor/proline dehydrogenase/delta 1-pyrroline-5-carboxylate dehydrogenase